jgi:hypothetical protein
VEILENEDRGLGLALAKQQSFDRIERVVATLKYEAPSCTT